MGFTDDQIFIYSRHILLPNVGGKGQRKLLEAKVLIIGAGGLGSPIALYLAAAGVGTIGLVDGDVVDLSNLQRQIAHHTSDINRLKVESAGEKIKSINPDVKVNLYPKRIGAKDILPLISEYDFIIEGTDNFPTKFLVNDACLKAGKPFSIGGILRFQGQTFTHVPGSACYRCIFRKPPPDGAVPTCAEAGVLGAVAGIIGTIQANEALKYILGIGELLTNRILMMDALGANFRTVPVSKDHKCPVCGENPTIHELIDPPAPTACSIRK